MGISVGRGLVLGLRGCFRFESWALIVIVLGLLVFWIGDGGFIVIYPCFLFLICVKGWG